MATWLSATVVAPLREVGAAARRIAGGQMGEPLPTDRADAIGDLMREIGQVGVNVLALVSDVRSQVAALETATGEIAQGNLDLSARTEQAASSLQQTAASMEEIAGTVRHSESSAQAATALAASTLEVARAGDAATSGVDATMREIAESARRIAERTGVIDSVLGTLVGGDPAAPVQGPLAWMALAASRRRDGQVQPATAASLTTGQAAAALPAATTSNPVAYIADFPANAVVTVDTVTYATTKITEGIGRVADLVARAD